MVTIEKIRNILKKKNVDALIIPTSDPHKSEYIPGYWKIRSFITGFTGSAGTAVITKNHAGMWTDARYFIQAEKQLAKPFVLHKLKTRQPEYIYWLTENLNPGQTVGIDANLFSVSEYDFFEKELSKKQISVTNTGDLFNELWTDRPALSTNKIFIHNEKFTGFSCTEKIEKIRTHLTETDTECIIVSALDDIAWLLNLRGSEIDYNPVFTAYLIISKTNATLFVDNKKLTTEVINKLKADKVSISEYPDIITYLKNSNFKNIEIDVYSLNYAVANSIPSLCKIKQNASFTSKLKAIKTNKEIAHYKNAQIRDGVAMCNFLCWLQNTVNKQMITELDAAAKSAEFRKQQDYFAGLSFEPISAYMENAALPHYSPDNKKPVFLEPFGMYLIDSGAQYFDGTTDITRTVALGKVTQEQKTDFTLVLKGHIRLATAKFPYGTKGFHLDTLSRFDLWQNGKDFGHGTGHGIGYFLNVHEGPQGLSQLHQGNASTIIEPGMLITNEPGFYLEGKYGIRIENVLACIKNSKTGFLEFETVTYCPIDIDLIDADILTSAERDWINKYHAKVYELISPHVEGDVLHWLVSKTQEI
jgi:Xaa-Pro aminopeptidase